jgi:prevent-host-death family protein
LAGHSQAGEGQINTIDAFDAGTRFPEILDRVENGEEIVVMRRGEPMARIIPFAVTPGATDTQRAMAEIRDRARELSIQATPEDIKEWINEGRKR